MVNSDHVGVVYMDSANEDIHGHNDHVGGRWTQVKKSQSPCRCTWSKTNCIHTINYDHVDLHGHNKLVDIHGHNVAHTSAHVGLHGHR